MYLFFDKTLDKRLIKEYNVRMNGGGSSMARDILSLIEATRSGDESAFEDIVAMYTPMMQAAAAGYSLQFDEVFSDACMALFRAVSSYDMRQNEVTFGLYARICIRHKMSDIASRSRAGFEKCDVDVDELEADVDDVGDALVSREEAELFRAKARSLLSQYEYDVLVMWLAGEKTAAIASVLGVSAKSVDNAKARITKKLRDGLR